MKMLWTIAWRNIWRNRSRSLVVMVALVLGLWAGNFMMGYAFGIYDQRLRTALEYELAHVQVHDSSFLLEQRTKDVVPDGSQTLEYLATLPDVRAISGRVVVYGMISSSRGAGGVRILGVDPVAEAGVSRVPAAVDTGSFFADEKRKRIVVGAPLAKKLRLSLGSSVVLKFQDAKGDFIDAGFKVGGIFKTPNSTFDERLVYVRSEELARLANTGNGIHEIALLLDDATSAEAFANAENERHPSALTEDWKARSPELELMIESTDQYFNIFLGIIMLAVAFGVINTMLMAVLDRTREIGVLMAVGMNRWRVFWLIVLETVLLMSAAAPVGLFLAWATITYFGQYGLDLSFVSEAYAMYGLDPIVYTHLAGSYYVRNLIILLVTALLSALLPAWTALRLKPVDAIRKI